MPPRNLKLSQLKLDLKNPRIRTAANQHDAMQNMLDDQGMKLANLAESIVERGSLNPMDRFLVMKDADGKYIVLEGNRRLLALKLLRNPKALTGLEVDRSVKKKIERSAAEFDLKKIEPLACFEVGDQSEAMTWIEQRHNGADEGRGIVEWQSEAKKRFIGSNPALQALDIIRAHGKLTPSQLEVISSRFPISTLDRLLSTPAVRKIIGVEIVNSKLASPFPLEEYVKPLKKIVLDLANPDDAKRVKVTQLKSVAQQKAYVEGFDRRDLPDEAKRAKLSVEIDVPSSRPLTRVEEKLPRRQAIQKRSTLVPKTCRLHVTNPNTLEIYQELMTLRVKDFRNATAVLLRVFLENSVDHYLESNGLQLSLEDAKSGKSRFKSLDHKLQEAIDHMIKSGTDKSHLVGVKRAISDSKHPLSIDLQHAYVHNRYVTPLESDLTAAWDNAQPFFE